MDRRAEIRSATSTAEFGGRVPGSEGWSVCGYLCGCLWSEQCGSFTTTCAAVCGANSVAVSPLPVRLSVERTVWQFHHYLCGCLWSEQCGSFTTTCAAVCGANSVAVSPLPVRLSVEPTVWQFQHYLCSCLWSQQCGSFNTTCEGVEWTVWQFQHYLWGCLWSEQCGNFTIFVTTTTIMHCARMQAHAECVWSCVYVCVCVGVGGWGGYRFAGKGCTHVRVKMSTYVTKRTNKIFSCLVFN